MDDDAAALGPEVEHQRDVVLLERGGRTIIGHEVLVDALGDQDVGGGLGQTVAAERSWRVGRRNEGQHREGVLGTSLHHIHPVLDRPSVLECELLRCFLACRENGPSRGRHILDELELPSRLGRQAEARHEGEVGPTGLGVVVEVVEHRGLEGNTQSSDRDGGGSGRFHPGGDTADQGGYTGDRMEKRHGIPGVGSFYGV